MKSCIFFAIISLVSQTIRASHCAQTAMRPQVESPAKRNRIDPAVKAAHQLFDAVKNRNESAVSQFLKLNSLNVSVRLEELKNIKQREEFRSDCVWPDDWTCLHFAAKNGFIEIFGLLAPRSDLKAKDFLGRTAFDIAVESGHSELVRRVFTPQYIGWLKVHELGFAGDVETLKREHTADLLSKDRRGRTVLHWAVLGRHLETVRWLLAVKQLKTMNDNKERGPLHYAVATGNIPVVKLLLEHDMPCHKPDSEGCTPLFFTTFAGHPELFDKLWASSDEKATRTWLKSSEFSIPSPNHLVLFDLLMAKRAECPPELLKFAIFEGNTELIKKIETACKAEEFDDDMNWTPLHYASHSDNAEIVKMFISSGSQKEAKTEDGLTPLHVAVAADALNAGSTLLTNGVDPNSRDGEGWTPLHRAAAFGNPEFVRLLLKHKANSALTTGKRGGKTALQLAGEYAVRPVHEGTARFNDIIHLLESATK